jgi:hypothetical protein
VRVGFSAALLIASAAVAHAQTPSDADVAFKQGRDLLKTGHYAEACAQFEKSQSLDPQLGTKFNIAQCDEKIGKLASALAIYRELSVSDNNDKRKGAATERADQLAAQVPKLIVQVNGSPPHLAVTLASESHTAPKAIEPNTPVELDDGDYNVRVRADGMADYTGSVTIRDHGRTTTLAVVLAPVGAPPPEVSPPREEPTPPPSPPPRSHRKQIAVGAIAAGGAAVVIGVVFGVIARGKWNDAKAVCGGGTACATPDDIARANSLKDAASSKATLATVFVLAGAALAGGGVALYVTAPAQHDVVVAPSASSDAAGLVVSGRF